LESRKQAETADLIQTEEPTAQKSSSSKFIRNLSRKWKKIEKSLKLKT
jgi:hypothetical protein